MIALVSSMSVISNDSEEGIAAPTSDGDYKATVLFQVLKQFVCNVPTYQLEDIHIIF